MVSRQAARLTERRSRMEAGKTTNIENAAVALDEFKELAAEMENAFYSAEYTDRYAVGNWAKDKALEQTYAVEQSTNNTTENPSEEMGDNEQNKASAANEDLDNIIDRKLLSIRVFNKGKEVRLSRSDIGQKFSLRVAFDKDEREEPTCASRKFSTDETAEGAAARDKFERPYCGGEYFDEWQLLDVDMKRSKGNSYVATGGGEYNFPIEKIEDY